jgi:arylsulfatase
VDCPALTAHIDVLPTLAAITGASLDEKVKQQIEGRSLFSLLRDPRTGWEDRTLVTHQGRWKRGQAAESKHRNCAIRNNRFSLVNNQELYDLESDPGVTMTVIDRHPGVVAELRAAYDEWWSEVQSMLVNEDAVGPEINPFKVRYWEQFGGGPDEEMLRLMDPARADRF